MDEKAELLRKADWANIYKNLVAKTLGRIDKYSWRTNTYPKGHTTESIVQEAIESVLNNTNNWDPKRGSLEIYLWWIIKRNLNHLFNSKKYHPDHITEESLNQKEGDEWKSNRMELKAQDEAFNAGLANPSPISSISQELIDEQSELKILALYESCENHLELKDIVDAIYKEQCLPKAAELAKYLNRPIEKIYLELRALRYRAKKIMEDLERQTDE